MNKILIVKTSSLGDIVHTFPVVHYLRAKFPSAQIDWVAEAPFASLVQSHPDIDRVLTIATKSWRKNLWGSETWRAVCSFRKELRSISYDAVFDLQGNVKSGLVVSQTKSRNKIGFGKKTVAEWPNLIFTGTRINPSKGENIREDYLSLVATFFQDAVQTQNTPIKLVITEEQRSSLNKIKEKSTGLSIIVCPGSAWRNKQLSTETLKGLLSLLKNYQECTFLFVWGSPEEKIVADELHREFAEQSLIVGKLSLPALQNLMAMSDLVIAMDSLPLHLAGTTTTPTFSIFGASSALKYKPLGENHFSFQGSCPYGRSFVKRCPILRTCKTGACIRDLQAMDIFESFKSWWKSR